MNEGLWAEFDKTVPYFFFVNAGHRSSRDKSISYALKTSAYMDLIGLTKPKQLTPTNLIKWSE